MPFIYPPIYHRSLKPWYYSLQRPISAPHSHTYRLKLPIDLLRFSCSPIFTNGPKLTTPELPQPSVLTQIPSFVSFWAPVPSQLHKFLTHTCLTGQPGNASPGVSETSVLKQGMRLALPHWYLFLSKQIPWLDSSVAQMQLEVVLLPELQGRSESQVELHGARAHTPFLQSWLGPQTLPQRPQLSLSVFKSKQVPLHSMVPTPLQVGVREVVVAGLVDVVFKGAKLVVWVAEGIEVILKDVEFVEGDVHDIAVVFVPGELEVKDE